jgi:hypothetical protein
MNSERNMKNYLYDNKEVVNDADYEECKASPLDKLLQKSSSSVEMWIVQCPKNYDVKNLLNNELRTAKIDVNRFDECVKFNCLIPQDESTDRVKCIEPIGKIRIFEDPKALIAKESKKVKRKKQNKNVEEEEEEEEETLPVKNKRKKIKEEKID